MTSPPGKTRRGVLGKFFGTLELIKFSHSVFALPFALAAMMVAANGIPGIWTLFWILWCLVSARTAAMAFNRWADWDYDVFNPRTMRRSQLGTRRSTLVLCVVALIAFAAGCAALNFLCLALCPVACAMILGYSLTKRFTAYSHAFLGLALAAAPMGAWGPRPLASSSRPCPGSSPPASGAGSSASTSSTPRRTSTSIAKPSFIPSPPATASPPPCD